MAAIHFLRNPAAALLAVTLYSPIAAAQPPAAPAGSQQALPINLDADSSSFDREHGRLLFRNVHIAQGGLSIQADSGEANQLDFEDSRWVFTGNVIVTDRTTKAFAETADLNFSGHQLRTAALRGTPAHFEDHRAQKGTTGRAEQIEYDVGAALLRLSVNAWVSDGSNEVTGEKISYDLQKDFVLAESGKGGKVRMLITPPAARKTQGAAP